MNIFVVKDKMKNLKNNWLKILVLLALFVLCAGLVFVQVSQSETMTKLESALISGLQFLASLAFAWVLAFWTFENGYKDKQKKFALGAFRRIKEIERNLIRTTDSVDESIKAGDDFRLCLEVVKANLVNAQDTVSSSIYDWSDIIEDEIEISAQIEKLEQSMSAKRDEPNEKNAEAEIEKLSSKLPPSLRQTVREQPNRESRISEAKSYLLQQVVENGHLDMRAFWAVDDGFMGESSKLNVGDVVWIARGFTKNRIGAILAYDHAGNSVGVIVNRCSALRVAYDIFSSAMDEIFQKQLRPTQFGGKPVEAVVTGIEEFDASLNRQYFMVQIQKEQFS